jgi:5-hydroxyisourate hydrolase
MARLSTHVLDTAGGKPAAGMRVRLFAIEGETRRRLQTLATNADGRCEAGEVAGSGVYEFEFGVGEYFRAGEYFGAGADGPPFLGEVVVRFGVRGDAAKYHVPLLVAPYGYSTYRGS